MSLENFVLVDWCARGIEDAKAGSSPKFWWSEDVRAIACDSETAYGWTQSEITASGRLYIEGYAVEMGR